MADEPSPSQNQPSESPTPEVLKPQDDQSAASAAEQSEAAVSAAAALAARRARRGTYRPSHKATFVGLAAIVAILAVNVVVVFIVIRSQSKGKSQSVGQDQVTISQSALDKLGVNRSAVGDAGIELTVNPNARFNGKLEVGGDVSVGGALKLNGVFSAQSANFAKLQAGDTSLSKLDVNGDATVTNFNARKDVVVTGQTRLQGAVTVSQLMTVNNNVNIAGSLAVGGALAVNSFHTGSLTADSNLTFGGHVITRGAAPGIGPGSALGSNGTVSISGSDAAGTVAANIGTGAGGGIIANIVFRQQYGSTPHVVITAVGAAVGSAYVSRTASGFSIGVSGGLAPGGYAFDYIVEQ